MRCLLALHLAVLLVFTGCASYTAGPAPVPQAGAMPAWRAEGTLAVGADPYVQLERQRAVFGADLNKAGLLPIQVLVQNQGDQRVWLRRSDIALELPEGSQIDPVRTTAATGPFRPFGVGGCRVCVEPVSMAAFLVAVVPVTVAAQEAWDARRADYWGKELRDVLLTKGESAHGFVFFPLPPGTQGHTEAALLLRFVDADDGASRMVRLPLRDVDLHGTPARGGGQGVKK